MIGRHIFHETMAWIERLNDYPGCDKKEHNMRVQLWFSSAYALLHVILLTIAFLIFAPEAIKILINYGIFLAICLTITLIITPPLRTKLKLAYAIHIFILLIGTFITILHLGGIATSGGLIVVCLAQVLCSVPLQDSKISLILFLVYTFILVVSSISGNFISAPDQLTPRINSILFLINTLSMSGLSFYLLLIFIKQQHTLDEMPSKHLKEVNEARNRMYTNITHEFRTPLTVIQGMANLIEENPDEWLGEGTQKIRKNSAVLLKLVNQMLDLAKIEAGSMPLNYVNGNINSHIKNVTGLFDSLAQIQGIKLSCSVMDQQFVMDYDPDKLLHIVSNLVTNALNYTPGGGKIEVSTRVEDHQTWFLIQISDNGVGIKPENLPHIFDRFFHTDHETINHQGTGLGLSLVKELVELMKGQIDVESPKECGTIFTVRLPVMNEVATTSENIIIDQSIADNYKLVLTAGNHLKTKSEMAVFEEKRLPVLLIIEDSNDVSQYLAAILKNEYLLDFAENGKVGLLKAIDRIPDIILSDVMMPKMDGIELLKKVKNDIRTSHIPVVLLTAKADLDSRISGLMRGADAYLAKPFEAKELYAVLKNLVEIRKKLHERYASLENFPLLIESVYSREDEFMSKVRQIMEANLDDDEFGVAQLCSDLAVSRTQLYRKFKSVCNKTIFEYFKALRLQKSKELFATTTMNVTEVAFASGFKNLSYFSREFSTEFGNSPLDFRKKIDLERTAKK